MPEPHEHPAPGPRRVAVEPDQAAEPGARWLRLTRWVLIVLFALFAILALVTNWLAIEILDEDRYVETMSGLVRNGAIQDAVADGVTVRLVDRFVTGDATASLFSTEGLTRLATIQLIDRTVQQVVASSAFEELWASANRIAHPRVVALLRGNSVAGFNVTGGQVVVDLGPVVTDVQARLREAGLPELVPTGDRDFSLVLLQSTELASAQRAVDLLVTLRWLLLVLALLSAAGFVYLSFDRVQGVMVTALAFAVAMVLLLAAIALVRAFSLDGWNVTLGDATTTAVFDIIGKNLRASARSLALGGLLIAGAAWVLMPGNNRRATVDGIVCRHRTVLYASILVLGVLAILLQDHPSPFDLAAIVLVSAVAASLVWWLARHAAAVSVAP